MSQTLISVAFHFFLFLLLYSFRVRTGVFDWRFFHFLVFLLRLNLRGFFKVSILLGPIPLNLFLSSEIAIHPFSQPLLEL